MISTEIRTESNEKPSLTLEIFRRQSNVHELTMCVNTSVIEEDQ